MQFYAFMVIFQLLQLLNSIFSHSSLPLGRNEMCFSTQCTHRYPRTNKSSKIYEFISKAHMKNDSLWWCCFVPVCRYYSTPNNTAPKIFPAIKQCQVLRTNKISIRVFGDVSFVIVSTIRNTMQMCKFCQFTFSNWNRKPHGTRCMSSTCDNLQIYSWNEINIEQK